MEDRIIPATRRPDGTWRKEIRVKAGYVPQDEVGAFETTASRMKTGKKSIPGYHPPTNPSTNTSNNSNNNNNNNKVNNNNNNNKTTTTATNNNNNKDNNNKSSKKTNQQPQAVAAPKKAGVVEEITSKVEAVNLKEESTQDDSSKLLRKLKKKLREIEALELKIKDGSIQSTDEIQNKIGQKHSIEVEIAQLENK